MTMENCLPVVAIDRIVDSHLDDPLAGLGAVADVRDYLNYICRLLDAEKYSQWLELCSPDFRYVIQTYSPELRREVLWMDKDRQSLATLCEQLPQHEKYPGSLRRMIGWTVVVQRQSPDTLFVESAFTAYHTDQYGTSILFCTGMYVDQISAEVGRFTLRSRLVQMDTRRLPFGSHVPI